MPVPEFTAEMTVREILDPAMEIAKHGDLGEAQEFMARYIDYLDARNPDWGIAKCREVALSNIGYGAGYYSGEMMAAVNEVFGAVHPVFGTRAPTPETAFAAGQKWAKDQIASR